MGKIRRQRKYDLDRMTCRELLVVVAPQRQAHGGLLFRYLYFGPDDDVRLLTRRRSDPLCAPHRRANELRAVRIALVLIVEHNLLRQYSALAGFRRLMGALKDL